MMQNKLTILLALVLLMFMSAVIKAETLKRSTLSTPVEGRHYTVLKNPGKTKAPTGKVEVIEFFWYGCPALLQAGTLYGKLGSKQIG